MQPNSWYICPILFIPAAVIWASLCVLCEHYCVYDKLSLRFNWKKQNVEKWLNRILGAVSLSLTTIAIFVVSYLIGFDLLNWEPF